MKKIFSFILLFYFINLSSAYAVDFDTSIDENIRKDYNLESSHVDMTLPSLPSVVPTENSPEISKQSYNPTGKTYTLNSGTRIILNSKNVISDRLQKGRKVSFACSNGILTKEKTIIPAGTIFKGTITDAHGPQITGNGGLVELKIDEIYFNGVMSKIDTKVSLANYKKVFFNDIKGKRSYWSNTNKVLTPGKKAFKATHKCASELGNIHIVNLLSPIVWLSGAVVYSVNAVAAPVIAIFTKGGNLSLPVGTQFEIKINGDNLIKG